MRYVRWVARGFPTVLAVLALLLLVSQLPVARAGETADSIEISSLTGDMEQYGGRVVSITGEAIGDVMRRGDFAWITVDDGPYSSKSLAEGGGFRGTGNTSIGVWAPAGDVAGIEHLGSYAEKGDIVNVVGVFNRACPEHGGDTDIHASSVQVIKPGHPFERPPNNWKLATAGLLLTLVALLMAIWRKYTMERGV